MLGNDIEPGDTWRLDGNDYMIVNTGILMGGLKKLTEDKITLVVIYGSTERPLLYVRDRREFLKYFHKVKKPK